MKLLIVDDSLIMRNAIRRNSAHTDITELYTAENGRRALELFIEHLPELVTMDLTMPELDGLSTISQMTEMRPNTAILVISALNSHQTAMDAIARGACGFLVKPFTALEVNDAIQDLVNHARTLEQAESDVPCAN
jgi:two-component system chemotaxis response regulator CheY